MATLVEPTHDTTSEYDLNFPAPAARATSDKRASDDMDIGTPVKRKVRPLPSRPFTSSLSASQSRERVFSASALHSVEGSFLPRKDPHHHLSDSEESDHDIIMNDDSNNYDDIEELQAISTLAITNAKDDDSDGEWEINLPLRHDNIFTREMDSHAKESKSTSSSDTAITFAEWEAVIGELLDEHLGPAPKPVEEREDELETEEEDGEDWEQAWPLTSSIRVDS